MTVRPASRPAPDIDLGVGHPAPLGASDTQRPSSLDNGERVRASAPIPSTELAGKGIGRSVRGLRSDPRDGQRRLMRHPGVVGSVAAHRGSLTAPTTRPSG